MYNKQDKYDLTQLTKFNHGLVYGFEPESSPSRVGGSETFDTAFFPEIGQHEDMLTAYFFAQDKILPVIEEKGFKNIDASTFLGWINTLHGLIGKTLLACHDVESGKYTDRFVCRWHKGARLNTHFFLYLSGKHPFCKTDQQLIDLLEQDMGVNKVDGLAFLKILKKLKTNTEIKVDANEIEFMKKRTKEHHIGISTLNKLVVAYNSEYLSSEEKKIVDKIVKICMFPSKVPGAMQAFAEETIAKYAKCDRQDLAAISKFLAETFYRLTEIHPYPNANGRVATLIMNIFLLSFGLPSILLRHPGDKENVDSKYSKAIANLDTSLKDLEELILMRIENAQKKPFSDEILEKNVALRVKFSHILKRIREKHPKFDLDSLKDELDLSELNGNINLNEQQIFVYSQLISIALEKEKRLDTMTRPALTSIQKKLDESAKNLLLSNLSDLSGKNGWKLNQNNGLVVWIELPSLRKEDVEKIVKVLEATEAMTVVSSKRKDNGVPVIKCDKIAYQKLDEHMKRLKQPGTESSQLEAEVSERNKGI